MKLLLDLKKGNSKNQRNTLEAKALSNKGGDQGNLSIIKEAGEFNPKNDSFVREGPHCSNIDLNIPFGKRSRMLSTQEDEEV